MRSVLAIGALALGGFYLLGRRITASVNPLLATPQDRANAWLSTQGMGVTPQATPLHALSVRAPSTRAFATQAGIGAGTSLGIAAVTTGVTSTALIATGIGAGVGALVWAIGAKGLFRGGEESLYVSPARDQFIAQFAPGVPYIQSTPDLVLGQLLNEALMAEGMTYESAERERQRLMDHGVYAAQHMDDLRASVREIQAILSRHGVSIGGVAA